MKIGKNECGVCSGGHLACRRAVASRPAEQRLHRLRAVQGPAPQKAFTLFEMIVATAAGSLIFAAIAAMTLYGGKSTMMMGNYVDLDRYSRNALDTMTTDIRQANSVTNCTTNMLQLITVDVNTGATNTLTYTYTANPGVLTRRLGTNASTTLLSGIVTNTFQFLMYQRNPVGGSVDHYQTTDPTQCKVVQMSWTCSRNVIGIGETESMQTAKVVIRKE